MQSISGKQYTLLFAEENSFSCVLEAIKSGKAVAVSSNYGGYPLMYGDHRLVKNANFPLREFYPEHDEICKLEGTGCSRCCAEHVIKLLQLITERAKSKIAGTGFGQKIKKNREFF